MMRAHCRYPTRVARGAEVGCTARARRRRRREVGSSRSRAGAPRNHSRRPASAPQAGGGDSEQGPHGWRSLDESYEGGICRRGRTSGWSARMDRRRSACQPAADFPPPVNRPSVALARVTRGVRTRVVRTAEKSAVRVAETATASVGATEKLMRRINLIGRSANSDWQTWGAFVVPRVRSCDPQPPPRHRPSPVRRRHEPSARDAREQRYPREQCSTVPFNVNLNKIK